MRSPSLRWAKGEGREVDRRGRGGGWIEDGTGMGTGMGMGGWRGRDMGMQQNREEGRWDARQLRGGEESGPMGGSGIVTLVLCSRFRIAAPERDWYRCPLATYFESCNVFLSRDTNTN